jgi:hypothetical protein
LKSHLILSGGIIAFHHYVSASVKYCLYRGVQLCSMAMSKYDEIFLGVLKEKGQVMPFLDAVFGFLYNW